MYVFSKKCLYFLWINIKEVELLDDGVVLFGRTSILFSILTTPVYIPTKSAQAFPFLHILTNACYFLPFWWYSDSCELMRSKWVLHMFTTFVWFVAIYLKFCQYFGLLGEELAHWKEPWCWERLRAGEEEDRGEEKKRKKMVGGHHWLSKQEFEQNLGHNEGQGSMTCCSAWGCKESDINSGWTTAMTMIVGDIMARTVCS